jgi:hypothetical protein
VVVAHHVDSDRGSCKLNDAKTRRPLVQCQVPSTSTSSQNVKMAVLEDEGSLLHAPT